MNTRFLLNLLTTRKRNSGFAMPMVIMTGLVITVAAAAIAMKGMNSQNQVTSQAAKSVSEQAAETGVTRMQAFLVQNPALAALPSSMWGQVQSGVFVPSSQLVSTLKETSCGYSGMTDSQIGTELSSTMPAVSINGQVVGNTGNLTNPSSNANTSPSFTVRDYRFDGQNATVHVSGFAGNDNAETNVVTSFAVSLNNVPDNTFFPGLWVKGNVTAGTNSSQPGTLDADILFECEAPEFTVTNDNGNSGYKKYVSGTSYLSLPASANPPQEIRAIMPDPPSSAPAGVTPASLGTVSGDLTLPRPVVDTTSSSNYDSSTQTYYYTADSISDAASLDEVNLQFTPGQKVAILLTGNVSIGGNSQITHDCGSTANCDATDVQILGSTSNASGTFSTSGNSAVCSIFFWAPTYTVEMNGGGSAGDCPSNANQNGIYWVNHWEGGGQGSHQALQQSGSNWNKIQAVVDVPVKNQLGSVASWAVMDRTGAETKMASIPYSPLVASSSTTPVVSPTTPVVSPTTPVVITPTPTASDFTNEASCKAAGFDWNNGQSDCRSNGNN